MYKLKKYLVRFHLPLFFLLFFQIPAAVATDSIWIAAIAVEGNKKTKEAIILREMDLVVGDSISLSQLHIRLEQNKGNILNTGLFTEVNLNITDWNQENNRVKIVVTVQENWYIYPIPLLELADRNFNVWWQEQGRDRKRINFGGDLYHINLTGNKDRLKIGLLFGYKQKYEIQYRIPYLDKKQTTGLTVEAYYSKRKEIAFQTIDDKLAFDRDDDQFQLYRFRTGFTLQYREKIRSYHRLKFSYRQNKISEKVAEELNPDYFLDGTRIQRAPKIRYSYVFDARDVRPYPMKGRYIAATIEKEGFGIFKDRNSLALSTKVEQLFYFNKKSSLSLLLRGKTELIRKKQAYADYQALGYQRDFLRGYELYVIDGLDFAYSQFTLKYELFNFNFNWGIWMPMKQMKKMPVRIMLIYYNDIGYVNALQFTAQNNMGNTLLWGTGLGLDFVVYYDKIIQLQFSRNHKNEYGLFLHNKIFF